MLVTTNKFQRQISKKICNLYLSSGQPKRKGSRTPQKIRKKYKHPKPGKDQLTITQSLAKMGSGDMGLAEIHYSTSSVHEEESHVSYCYSLPPSKQFFQVCVATVADEKKKHQYKSGESEQDVADFQLESENHSMNKNKDIIEYHDLSSVSHQDVTADYCCKVAEEAIDLALCTTTRSLVGIAQGTLINSSTWHQLVGLGEAVQQPTPRCTIVHWTIFSSKKEEDLSLKLSTFHLLVSRPTWNTHVLRLKMTLKSIVGKNVLLLPLT